MLMRGPFFLNTLFNSAVTLDAESLRCQVFSEVAAGEGSMHEATETPPPLQSKWYHCRRHT